MGVCNGDGKFMSILTPPHYFKHRELIRSLIVRDISSKYKGSAFGILWALINPLMMLLVYTFVFSVVFKARWNVDSESKIEFSMVLFSGLMVFNIFAECIVRASTLIISNASYVKKIVFPLDVLVLVNVGSALFQFFMSLLVWGGMHLLFIGLPHKTFLFIPFIIFPYLLFVTGFSWFIASLGVYVRDISQVIGLIVTVLMFMSPVFYPISALPEHLKLFMILNPLSYPIEAIRDAVYWGRGPTVSVLLGYYGFSLCVFFLGYSWFSKTKKGFADVI